MKYIDIHTHVNFKAFDEDRDEVIRRALDSDTWIINVGTQKDTSKSAIDLAHKYSEGVYAIVGLHPIHTSASYHDEKELGEPSSAKATDGQGEVKGFTSRGEVLDKEVYGEFLRDPKVVGIGECGLDYYRCTPETIENQKKAFLSQIELANEFNKPLMLHIRNNPEDKTLNAYQDSISLLKEHYKGKENSGNVHFFAGSKQEAKDFLDLGFTLSFTGVITFTTDYDEIIADIPLDMLMSETDAPYVTPVPHRGKRNEPSYVKEVVKKIAKIKNLPEEEVAKQVFENAKRVFGI